VSTPSRALSRWRLGISRLTSLTALVRRRRAGLWGRGAPRVRGSVFVWCDPLNEGILGAPPEGALRGPCQRGLPTPLP
jgi:hypothetical protein